VGVAAEINFRRLRTSRICMSNTNFVPFMVFEISAFIQRNKQTDRRTWLGSTRLVFLIKNFMGSETLPSTCYILSDESSIPFYSTSNGYIYERSVFWTLKYIKNSSTEKTFSETPKKSN